MGLFQYVGDKSNSGGFAGALVRIVLRFMQFIMAITVIGLYAIDLDNAKKAGGYSDPKWIFAVVTASLSAVTVLVYALPFLPSYLFFAWDWVLFILWTAVFGTFGNIYIKARPTPEQHGQWRMKNAVWVDLVNMILWLLTAAYATIIWFRSRNTRTLHTGRARV